jgi:thioredoxin-dependent peroxiredoxin
LILAGRAAGVNGAGTVARRASGWYTDSEEITMAQLKVGDKAPAFSLEDQQGRAVTLADFKGKKLLVYFYPKASTPGCTVQSCNVRDARRDFSKKGVAVIGVSPDKPAAQKKFDEKYTLGFPLLADTEHTMAEAYGVWGEKSMYGRKYFGIVRSSFLIDEKGKIAGAWYKVSPADTVPEAMKLL